MRGLRKIAQSIGSTSRLQRKYYLLTTCMGVLAAAIGATAVSYLMYKTRAFLGLPMEKASLEGRVLPFLAWICVTLVSIPVIFYGSMVLVGGTLGLIMMIRGAFTPAEAKAYALYGAFPSYWFRKEF